MDSIMDPLIGARFFMFIRVRSNLLVSNVKVKIFSLDMFFTFLAIHMNYICQFYPLNRFNES